jgi:hypothetical protein
VGFQFFSKPKIKIDDEKIFRLVLLQTRKIIFLDLSQKGEKESLYVLLVYRANKALGKGVEIKFGFKRGEKNTNCRKKNMEGKRGGLFTK